MVRCTPAYGNLSIDTILLSYALFAAGVATTFSIIIAMCGLITGRKEAPPPSTDVKSQESANENPTTEQSGEENAEEDASEELPLPPGRQLKGSQSTVLRTNLDKPALTTTNLRVTMSMRKEKPSMADINIQKKDQKMKRGDSIWMRPIILGEKCRVPGNVGGEGDDANVINVNGSIASMNFRRHLRQLTISRNNSFTEKIVVPADDPSS